MLCILFLALFLSIYFSPSLCFAWLFLGGLLAILLLDVFILLIFVLFLPCRLPDLENVVSRFIHFSAKGCRCEGFLPCGFIFSPFLSVVYSLSRSRSLSFCLFLSISVFCLVVLGWPCLRLSCSMFSYCSFSFSPHRLPDIEDVLPNHSS
jgi:hypothetical protein